MKAEAPVSGRSPRAEATVLHVDMDAFFVAVEVLADAGLRGRPVVVGGSGRRGVVAAASYEARVYGIHSAMPSLQARQLCPHAVFIPGHHDLYADYSARLHEIFGRFTPLVEGIALDEAFLDVAGSRRLFGPAPVIAAAIRSVIDEELGLAASVGVASSKLVAKLASEAAKPTITGGAVRPGPGVVVVEAGTELAFLHPRAVTALWGVGPVTASRLGRLGVVTIGDLATVSPGALDQALGVAHARHLRELAWGLDDRPVEVNRAAKSIGQEETYPHDRHEVEECRREVVRLADSVSARLRAEGLAGRTVTLKVRFGDFSTITRAETQPRPVATGVAVARVATGLLEAVEVSRGVRLLGVSVSNLTGASAEQLTLSLGDPELSSGPSRPDVEVSWGRVTSVLDAVRERFGASALGPASLLGGRGLQVKRRGDAPWGPEGPSEVGRRPSR